MTPKLCIGSCCDLGRERWPAQSFVEIADADGRPAPGAVLAADTPVRAYEAEAERDLATCAHEAGHAVAATVGGIHVDFVTVDEIPKAVVDWKRTGPVLNGALLRMLFVGPQSENKSVRHEYRAPNEEIIAFVTAARDGRGGGCDFCRIAKIVAAVDDADIVEVWHELEGDALNWLRRADVWTTIRALAARLFQVGKIEGDEVREIVRVHGLHMEKANVDV